MKSAILLEGLESSKEKEYRSLIERHSIIKRIKEARIKNNPLAFYWPHSEGCDGKSCWKTKNTYIDAYGQTYEIGGCPQYFFHTSLADVRTFLGSNQSGKTTAGVVEVGIQVTGLYPEWYPLERRYNYPIVGRILANDFKKAVGEVITRAIDNWIPKHLIADKDKSSQGVYDKYWIKHSSGGVSSFDIITYEQGSEVAEGWVGKFAWYDEPPPHQHYIATSRGLIQQNGWSIFTLTPLKEPWIFDSLFAQGNLISVTK